MYVSLFCSLELENKPIVGDIVLLPGLGWSRTISENLYPYGQIGMVPLVPTEIIHPNENFIFDNLQISSETSKFRIDSINVMEALYPEEENRWLENLNRPYLTIVELTIVH